MNKLYAVFMTLLTLWFMAPVKGWAGFVIRSKTQAQPPESGSGVESGDAADLSRAPGHSHSHGHSHGHSHSRGGYHGAHWHHTYRYHEHHHHYADHYRHYHSHYRAWHEWHFLGLDYAGLSILFDILVVTCPLGILFGAIGMSHGLRRGLAALGFVLGILELAAIILLLTI